MKKNLSLLLVLLFLIISCSKDETTPDDPAEDNVVLVSQELIDTISNETIQGIASAFFSSTPIYSMLTYADVQVYKTTYRTLDVSGNPIIASGLVLAPLTNEQVPIISFQHGTQHNPNDACLILTTMIPIF